MDKRNENMEWSEEEDRRGSGRGLLIRESLVTESFEMTADLRESIIRLCSATGLLPPAPLRGNVFYPKKKSGRELGRRGAEARGNSM